MFVFIVITFSGFNSELFTFYDFLFEKKSSLSLLIVIKSIYLGFQSGNVKDLAKSKHPCQGKTQHRTALWLIGNSDSHWGILICLEILRAS